MCREKANTKAKIVTSRIVYNWNFSSRKFTVFRMCGARSVHWVSVAATTADGLGASRRHHHTLFKVKHSKDVFSLPEELWRVGDFCEMRMWTACFDLNALLRRIYQTKWILRACNAILVFRRAEPLYGCGVAVVVVRLRGWKLMQAKRANYIYVSNIIVRSTSHNKTRPHTHTRGKSNILPS